MNDAARRAQVVQARHRRVLLLVFLLGLASCGGGEWPKPVSAKILPYRAAERGKFVEVCFDRRLRKGERYDFEFRIETKRGTRQTCSGVLADSFDETPEQCHRFNLFVYCATNGGFSNPAKTTELMRIIREDIEPDNVAEFTMRMWPNQYEKEARVFSFQGL